MLKRLLEYNFSAIGIFLFLALIKTLLFFTGQVESGDYDYSLFSIFQGTGFWSGIFAALVTVLLGAFVLINSERHAKRSDFSYLLVLIFGFLFCFNKYYAITVEHLGLFFFITSFYFLSKGISNLRRSDSVIGTFNMAFALSIGTLFTPHLIYMLPIFWIGAVVISTSSFKGFIASLLGFVLPYVIIDTLIYSLYHDVASYTHLYVIEQLGRTLESSVIQIQGWEQLANVGPIILIIISTYITFLNTFSVKTVVRKFNLVNFFFLLYTILMIVTGLIPSHFGMMVLFIPTAYLFSNFHTLASPSKQNAFLYVLLVSAALSYPPVMEGIISLYELVF
jgi:hypothetical protein